MPHVSNILVPIDIHENTLPIVQWAALFARATSSQLTLLQRCFAAPPASAGT